MKSEITIQSSLREVWEYCNFQMKADGSSPKSNLHNVMQFLRKYPMYYKRIFWDDFSNRKFLKSGAEIIEITDADITRITEVIQVKGGLYNIKSSIVSEAITAVSQENRKHEVRDWFNTLCWDNVDRIAMSFSNHFGVEINDFTTSVSKNFWISLVARVLKPGCKVDNMVILESKQGRGKSTALSIIGGKYYGEINEPIGSKDFPLACSGKIINELAELASFSKAETSMLKKMISGSVDRFRPPYGKNAIDYPRQFIMVGSTNDNTYLKDATGGRRFWPVRVGQINLELLRQEREQLFAEAIVRFKNDESWWEVPLEQSLYEQEDRRNADPLEQVLTEMLENEIDITVKDIFLKLGYAFERQTSSEALRITKILPMLGFERHQRSDKHRTRAWRRISNEPL